MLLSFFFLGFEFKLYNLNSLNIPINTDGYSAYTCCKGSFKAFFWAQHKIIRALLITFLLFSHPVIIFIHRLIYNYNACMFFSYFFIIFIVYSRHLFYFSNQHVNSWLFKFFFFNLYSNLKKFLNLNVNDQFLWYFSIWFIFTLFNLSSLLPKIPAFTSFILIPIFFSFLTFTVINFNSVISNSENWVLILLPGRLSVFLAPLVIFIEFISYLIRPVSLSVRLFANILSGHILIHIISGYAYAFLNNNFFSCFFFVTLMLVMLNGLEYFIALIQSTVFVLITVITQSDNTNL